MGKKPLKSVTESRGSVERVGDLAALEQLCQSYLANVNGTPYHAEKPLIRSIGKYSSERRKRRNFVRIACYIGVFLTALYAVSLLVPQTFAVAVFRLALIQVLPYWDWTYLRDVPCLWHKQPVAVEDSVGQNASMPTPEHCVVCEDLTEIFVRKGGILSPLQVGEDFLVEELPLVLRSAFMVEPEGPNLQLRPILKLHLEDEALTPCKFRTNLRTKSAFQFHTFLAKVQRDDLQIPWFGFWEFCQHNHVKECRAIIPRPPELPSMLEIADSFWFFTASNFTATKHKFVDVSFSVFWFTQMAGTSKIRLDPKAPCDRVCHVLEAELHPGDALLMTTDLFEIGWMPGVEEEVLAVAAGAQ